MMHSTEQLEQLQPTNDEITVLVEALKRLQQAEGPKEAVMPNLTLEQQELSEKNESLLKRAKEAIKNAFDFLVIEPAKWVGTQIKEHPIRTAMIALAAFALWYYSAPLSAGLSVLKEKGIQITADLVGSAVQIDPWQVDVFDQLMTAAP